MLASELIKELQRAIEQYGDLNVLTEGCDCWGESGHIEEQDGDIVIYRSVPIKPPQAVDIPRPDPLADYPEDMKP